MTLKGSRRYGTIHRAIASRSWRTKVLDWLAASVLAVLVVGPQTRLVHHYRSAAKIEVYTRESVDRGPVIEGFQLDVTVLFSLVYPIGHWWGGNFSC